MPLKNLYCATSLAYGITDMKYLHSIIREFNAYSRARQLGDSTNITFQIFYEQESI